MFAHGAELISPFMNHAQSQNVNISIRTASNVTSLRNETKTTTDITNTVAAAMVEAVFNASLSISDYLASSSTSTKGGD